MIHPQPKLQLIGLMGKILMEDPSRCRLLPGGLSSVKEEVAEAAVVAAAEDAVAVVLEAEVALEVVVPHLMLEEETGRVLTARVEI